MDLWQSSDSIIYCIFHSVFFFFLFLKKKKKNSNSVQQPRSWADINTPIQLGADFHPGHRAAWNTGLARYAEGSSSSWATGLGELQSLFERAKAAAAGHGPCAGRRHPGPLERPNLYWPLQLLLYWLANTCKVEGWSPCIFYRTGFLQLLEADSNPHRHLPKVLMLFPPNLDESFNSAKSLPHSPFKAIPVFSFAPSTWCHPRFHLCLSLLLFLCSI